MKSEIITLFLYTKKTTSVELVLKILGSLNLTWCKFNQIQTNMEVVSSIVPMSLREDAESWLLFYLNSNLTEVLVLPFPDYKVIHRTKVNKNYFRKYVLEYLNAIYNNKNKYWGLIQGYVNLQELKRLRYPDAIRFELIQLPKRVSNFLNNNISEQEKKKKFIYEKLEAANKSIQLYRNNFLFNLVSGVTDDVGRQELIRTFEDDVINENIEIFENIKYQHNVVIPLIIEKFEELMSSETKSFITSAITVGKYARNYMPQEFDFSLPGSGLWKAIELELNLSLVWYLRYCRNLVGEDPWVPLKKESYSIETGKGSVNLNSKQNKKFKGIMLGQIEHLLRTAGRNGIANNFKQIFNTDSLMFVIGDKKTELPSLIMELRKLRNKHAHISPMSLEQYKRLQNLVLSPKDKPKESFLGKIMILKGLVRNLF